MRMLEIECDHVSLGFAFGPYIEEFRIGIGANCRNQKDRFRPPLFCYPCRQDRILVIHLVVRGLLRRVRPGCAKSNEDFIRGDF